MSNKARYLTLAGMQIRDDRLHVTLVQAEYVQYLYCYRYRVRCHGCGEGSFNSALVEEASQQARKHAASCTGVPEGWSFPPREHCYHPPTR